MESEAIWAQFLSNTYGNVVMQMLSEGANVGRINESIWWKDLKFIGGNDVTRNEWLVENITFKLGCGINIPF